MALMTDEFACEMLKVEHMLARKGKRNGKRHYRTRQLVKHCANKRARIANAQVIENGLADFIAEQDIFTCEDSLEITFGEYRQFDQIDELFEKRQEMKEAINGYDEWRDEYYKDTDWI